MKSGIGFDASNYGYAVVEKSDMVFIPDPVTALINPPSGGIRQVLQPVIPAAPHLPLTGAEPFCVAIPRRDVV